ncbi:MAG: hypothetical protein JWP14_2140 [Frankiales bacterium]|jgi:hypothetical protein|nr:hypothetical protein [Frankiales bacterium]
MSGQVPSRDSADDLERRRQEVKAARAWARKAHPFDRSRLQDDEADVIDDGTESDVALVAFPGTEDRLGVPAVDFFEQIAEWPVRRIYVRKLRPSLGIHHELGTTVPEIATSLRAMTHHHRRTVFLGTSLGGFHALLLGTLVGADVVLGINPVTSLFREVLDEAGDQRWDGSLAYTSAEWLRDYGDIPTLWAQHRSPRSVLHFAYRYRAYCVQAEHIAELPNVSLHPHFEYSPMNKLIAGGEMRSLLASLLWPEGNSPRQL